MGVTVGEVVYVGEFKISLISGIVEITRVGENGVIFEGKIKDITSDLRDLIFALEDLES